MNATQLLASGEQQGVRFTVVQGSVHCIELGRVDLEQVN